MWQELKTYKIHEAAALHFRCKIFFNFQHFCDHLISATWGIFDKLQKLNLQIFPCSIDAVVRRRVKIYFLGTFVTKKIPINTSYFPILFLSHIFNLEMIKSIAVNDWWKYSLSFPQCCFSDYDVVNLQINEDECHCTPCDLIFPRSYKARDKYCTHCSYNEVLFISFIMSYWAALRKVRIIWSYLLLVLLIQFCYYSNCYIFLSLEIVIV